MPKAVGEMETTIAEGAWILYSFASVVVVIEPVTIYSAMITVFCALSKKVQSKGDLGKERTEMWNAKLQAIRIEERKGIFQIEKKGNW